MIPPAGADGIESADLESQVGFLGFGEKNALLKSCLVHLREQAKMYLEHTAIQIVL